MSTKTTLARVPLYNNTLKEFAFGASGYWIAMADGKPTVRLIDPHSAQPEILQLRHQHWPSSMALSPDGRRVATVEYMQLASHGSSEASRRRFREVWNSTLKGKSTGKGESTEKGENRIWDLATGQVIATIPHDGGVYQIAFHPAGNLIATAGADHTARLWDATTGMERGQLNAWCEIT
jgi:WD40 repeat protein